jgi:hypothetical protein
MNRRIVHGTPITPNALLEQLDGASFCVSFARPDQLEAAIEKVGQDEILLLDNGAFSIWMAGRKGKKLPSRLTFDTPADYRHAFWAWANEIQARCPQAVAVIPDVIEGSEQENLVEVSWALKYGLADYPERAMAIWHLDESLDQLQTLALVTNFVGFGSCAQYDVQRQRKAYIERIREASAHIDWIEISAERRPWVHLMRGLGIFAEMPRFESADSTNVAANHHRYKKNGGDYVADFAARISAPIQAAGRVTSHAPHPNF